ncbi:MAG: putative membrane protein [Candidatus Nanohaloarchaea archaeon]|jgi:uncharacterized membrane protein
MMKRLSLILVLAVFITGFAQASPNYSEDFKLEIGEQTKLGDYEFRFNEDNNGEGIFQTGIIQDNGGVIINKQLVGDEIKESEGKRINLDNNLNYTIKESYRGINGRYLILGVNSSKDVFASAELDADSPQRVLVDQGGTVDFSFELENTGVVNQTFQLSNTGTGISSSFNYQGYNVSQVFIPGGESRTISAELKVDKTTPVGLKNIEIVAKNRSTTSDSILLSVLEKERQERGEPRIDVSLTEQYSRTNPGESITVPVNVRNSGRVTLENVQVTVEGPDGWTTEVQPQELGTLDEYRSERATVTIQPPADVSQGDYFVDVSASSDQVGLDEPQQVRVNITEKSGLRYAGIAIMILSFAALIFVYRRFGRR